MQAEVLQQRVLVSEYKRVISAKREARRSRNEVKRTEQEEARRAAILAKEAAVERHLKQRAEVRGSRGHQASLEGSEGRV